MEVVLGVLELAGRPEEAGILFVAFVSLLGHPVERQLAPGFAEHCEAAGELVESWTPEPYPVALLVEH